MNNNFYKGSVVCVKHDNYYFTKNTPHVIQSFDSITNHFNLFNKEEHVVLLADKPLDKNDVQHKGRYCNKIYLTIMKDLNLDDMIYWSNTLRFKKSGKNQYTVINKQNKVVGITTGQSRYWYFRCYDLMRYYKYNPSYKYFSNNPKDYIK